MFKYNTTGLMEQQLLRQQLEKTQELLHTLIDSMPDFVCFKDGEGRWMLANKYALSLFQIEGTVCQGKTDLELAAHAAYFRESLLSCMASDRRAWETGQPIRTEEIIRKPDGCKLILDVLKTPLFNPDGTRKGLVIVGRDVTKRKEYEELNRYLACHDSLTRLPNRLAFEKKLAESLLESVTIQEKAAVLYLDLDRFKYLNNTLGHDVGDLLVKDVTERLKSGLPADGYLARMGADEFTVILHGVREIQDVTKVAEQIIRSMDCPFLIRDYELYITMSMGISVFPDDGNSVQELMRNAGAALRRAKDKGVNEVQVYYPQMNSRTCKTLTLEKDLHKAIQQEEFEIYYQPRVDAHSGRILSAEALIRWNHPVMGLTGPDEFIPLAIETGLIIPIGKWVKNQVCKQIKTWLLEGLSLVPVSVNIDPKRFMQKDFVMHVQKILDQYQLEGKWLEIEITETSLMENEETAATTIRELQRLGVEISLDDFGTGYSAISYLRDFNINSIKIDQSYIRDIHSNASNTKIVSGIIQLAQSLDISIVAEGVETQAQLRFLKEQNCNQIQGYLFSKPVPSKEFKQLLQKRHLKPQAKNDL